MVATIQALLRGASLRDDRRGRALLAPSQRGADKWAMTIVPRGFDEDAPQVSIPRFGDRAARLFRATRMLGRHEPDKGHRPRRRCEAARVTEFRRDRERRQIVNPPKTSQPVDARLQR